MAKSFSSCICISVLCLLFIASTHCVNPHTALPFSSSSLLGTPHSFLTSQKALSLELVGETPQEKFHRYVLYGGKESDRNDTPVEDPIENWLRPRKQKLPEQQAPVAASSIAQEPQPQASTAASTSAQQPDSAHPIVAGVDQGLGPVEKYPVGEDHHGVFEGGPLKQPALPKQGTLARELWDATFDVVIQYKHAVYFKALISLAHPPRLHQAVKAIELPGWSEYTEAAITSLLADAGIPRGEIITAITSKFTGNEAIVKDIVSELAPPGLLHQDDVEGRPPDNPATSSRSTSAVPSTSDKDEAFDPSVQTEPLHLSAPPRTKTYAELFDNILFSHEIFNSKNRPLMYELVEFIRIKSIMEMTPKHKEDKALILYALPFLPQLHPLFLLKYLHEYLQIIDGKTKEKEESFEIWLSEQQEAPHSRKYEDSAQRHLKLPLGEIFKVVPVAVRQFDSSDDWVIEPFDSASVHLTSFLNPFIQEISFAHAMLAMVMSSHCLLYLRRFNAKTTVHPETRRYNQKLTVPQIVAFSTGDGAGKKASAAIKNYSKNIVVNSWFTMLRNAKFKNEKSDDYSVVDINHALLHVGGIADPHCSHQPPQSWDADEEGASSATGPSQAKQRKTAG